MQIRLKRSHAPAKQLPQGHLWGLQGNTHQNLEVEVGVPLLVIHLDSIQAQFRVWLEESKEAGAIREAVQKVEKWIGWV